MLHMIDPVTKKVWSLGGEKRHLHHCYTRMSAYIYVKRMGKG